MVYIAPPPPQIQPQPQFHVVQTGDGLVRMYNPASHKAQALTFRRFGPLRRFDHQRQAEEPGEDLERGILYAGATLSGCIVEIFGDTKVIVVGSWEAAYLKAKRDLRLLDLRNGNAMRAGTVAAVCKDSNHQSSQEWSRYFYENTFLYTEIDGLIFGNAHNEETAFALYERAETGLDCIMSCPLNDESLRPEVLSCANEFNMIVEPY